MFFNLTELERKRILKLHKKETILEQTTPTLVSVLSTKPEFLNFFSDATPSNIIYLTQRDAKGNVIPNTKYSYKVTEEYGMFDIDFKLRNLKRNAKGDLIGQAQPSSRITNWLFGKLIPKENKTPDGWMYIRVPVNKLNEGLLNLKKSNGNEATIDAGNNVKIKLKLVTQKPA